MRQPQPWPDSLLWNQHGFGDVLVGEGGIFFYYYFLLFPREEADWASRGSAPGAEAARGP